MKTIVRNLFGALLVATVAIGTGRPQSASRELRLSDIRAQQPQETIVASAPCQRAMEAPRGLIYQPYVIDPKTLVKDLNTLMDMSDEVILAGMLDTRSVISPSGETTATYVEVRVIRNWKGPHYPGDTLTFGIPYGEVSCEPTGRFDGSTFSNVPGDFGVPAPEPFAYVWVLFLRQSEGNETQRVQGLRLVAGEGLQGMFTIEVPPPLHDEPERECSGNQWSWQRCDAYLKASQIPVMVPYAHDPLAKTYGGTPVSDFLLQVQSVAAGQGFADKSSLNRVPSPLLHATGNGPWTQPLCEPLYCVLSNAISQLLRLRPEITADAHLWRTLSSRLCRLPARGAGVARMFPLGHKPRRSNATLRCISAEAFPM